MIFIKLPSAMLTRNTRKYLVTRTVLRMHLSYAVTDCLNVGFPKRIRSEQLNFRPFHVQKTS